VSSTDDSGARPLADAAEPRTVELGPGRQGETVLVAAAIVIEGERVLVTQRKTGTHLAGVWEFPGGKVAPGEDPRDGLRRELAEELGIDVRVGEIVDVTFHRYEDAQKSVLLLFFEATRVPGSPDPQAIDVAAFTWAASEDLDPTRYPPADVAVLAKVRRRLRSGGFAGER
jgi:8-oxo-dGTP diphosphatase